MRIHHALADGIAGTSLLKLILDPTPAPPRPPRKPRYCPRPVPESSGSLTDALTSALHSSVESLIAVETLLLDFGKSLLEDRTKDALQKVLALVPEIGASSERFVFNKPCTGRAEVLLDGVSAGRYIQAIRAVAGGTLNDVALTVIARGVAKYIRLHGEPVTGRYLRVVCPVNVRTEDGGVSLGNQISFLPVALPLDIQDPIAFVAAVSARTEVMKNSRASHLVALLSRWIGRGAASAAAFVLANAAHDRAADAAVQHDLHQYPGFAGALVFGGAQNDCVVSARADGTGIGRELRRSELRRPAVRRVHRRCQRGSRCWPAARSDARGIRRVIARRRPAQAARATRRGEFAPPQGTDFSVSDSRGGCERRSSTFGAAGK